MSIYNHSFRPALWASQGCLLLILCSGSACSGGARSTQEENQAQVAPVVLEPKASSNSKISPSHDAQARIQEEISVPAVPTAEAINIENEPVSSQIQDAEALQLIQAQNKALLDEVLGLYQRLHIELDSAGRSQLIVDLFQDDRYLVQFLGFELADRDLSNSTTLHPSVGEVAKAMIQNQNPKIRAKAARLITRLVLPDAMIVLTEAIRIETDPLPAEAMLIGIARWPNAESVELVMKWFLREDAPFGSACDAAWAMQEQGLWNAQQDHPLLLERLRSIDTDGLNATGMKLLADFGDASDLNALKPILQSSTPIRRQWAANALSATPRGVDILVQAAEQSDELFEAASTSLILHRATPVGLQRIMSLPWVDEKARDGAIRRMGEAIENDRLTEAVKLANLDPAHSVLLLSRLLNGQVEITTRVSKGIVLLAQIELDEARPNRALEAATALDGVDIDPPDRLKIDVIRASSLILLGKLNEAKEFNGDIEFWLQMLVNLKDTDLQLSMAEFVLSSFAETLTDIQATQLREIAGIPEPIEEEPSENISENADEG